MLSSCTQTSEGARAHSFPWGGAGLGPLVSAQCAVIAGKGLALNRREEPWFVWLPVFLWGLVEGPCWVRPKDKNHKKLNRKCKASRCLGAQRGYTRTHRQPELTGSATHGHQARHAAEVRNTAVQAMTSTGGLCIVGRVGVDY